MTARIFAFCAAIAFSISSGAAASETALPQGAVTLAKTTPDALLIWDATPAVAALRKARTDPRVGLAQLEAGAMSIALARAASLTHSTNVSVRVLYEMTGDVSPVYHSATFEGVERLLTVTATRSDILANGAAYAEQLERGTIPAAVKVSISGALPPQQ